MAKTTTPIRVGDYVRSFDFEGRDLIGNRASYVEGPVLRIVEAGGCTRYMILVERCVFGGVEMNRDGILKRFTTRCAYPPVNGTEVLGSPRLTDYAVLLDKVVKDTKGVYDPVVIDSEGGDVLRRALEVMMGCRLDEVDGSVVDEALGHLTVEPYTPKGGFM